jgi:pimeloyl-ACP methyl ester carboxylesterase
MSLCVGVHVSVSVSTVCPPCASELLKARWGAEFLLATDAVWQCELLLPCALLTPDAAWGDAFTAHVARTVVCPRCTAATAEFTTPTLIMHGDKDGLVLVEGSK